MNDEMGKKEEMVIEYLSTRVSLDDIDKMMPGGVSQDQIHQILELTNEVKAFRQLMMYYECAMEEVTTKLEVLDKELSLEQRRNPFESIKSRLKTPVSIYEKMKRRGIPFSVENIEKNLNDVAGIRVICSFIDDIYRLRDCLVRQDDVTLIQEKDYIRDPKSNGYRSLHLILEIPIFLTQDKKMVRVEVQFRTIAMDFWASLEHTLQYKKEIPDEEAVSAQLKESAELINQLDLRMQQIRVKIDAAENIKDD